MTVRARDGGVCCSFWQNTEESFTSIRGSLRPTLQEFAGVSGSVTSLPHPQLAGVLFDCATPFPIRKEICQYSVCSQLRVIDQLL